MSEKALMTVQSDDGPPTLEAAARQLGVHPEALDETFGVVLIDPKSGLYSVQVDASQLPSEPETGDDYQGPYSTPRIESFGPPRKEPHDAGKKKR
jgi:hypothetical protein